MNRFDDAVLDLVSSAPAATTVDGLRARIRRHRLRRVVAIVAVAGVISVASVGIAASLGHKTGSPLIAVSPTTSTTVGGPRVSCPPMSRANAVQRAMKVPGGSPTSPVRAKLMRWAELHAHVPDAPSPLLTATTQVWVVEVRDWYFHDEPGPAADQPKPFPWALFIIDAYTGAPYGPVTGPGNSTPYWDLLPDHSKTCAPSTFVPQPTPGPAFLGVGVDDAGQRVHVDNVLARSPAAAAGLAPGDIIDSIDGTPLASLPEVKNLLTHLHPGDMLNIVWTDHLKRKHAHQLRLASGIGTP